MDDDASSSLAPRDTAAATGEEEEEEETSCLGLPLDVTTDEEVDDNNDDVSHDAQPRRRRRGNLPQQQQSPPSNNLAAAPPKQPQQQHLQQPLEERVEQLELKLATLSRLLQLQTVASVHSNTNTTNTHSEATHHPPSSSSLRTPSPPFVLLQRRRRPPQQPQQSASSSSRQCRSVSPRPPPVFPLSPEHEEEEEEEPLLARTTTTTRQRPLLLPPRMRKNQRDNEDHRDERLPHPQQQQQQLEDLRSIIHDDDDDRRGGVGAADENDKDDQEITQTNREPDPPEPPTLALRTQQKRNRNLSLMLLFEGNEEEYHKQQPQHSAESMTPAERQWLRPQLEQYYSTQDPPQPQPHSQQQQSEDPLQHDTGQKTTSSSIRDAHPHVYEHEHDIHQPLIPAEEEEATNIAHRPTLTFDIDTKTSVAAASTTTTTPLPIRGIMTAAPEPTNSTTTTPGTTVTPQRRGPSRQRSGSITKDLLKKKLQTKWLDYLNSVQETTPDVDVQMQEFIKVPPALEGILGFGLLICLDSFLYMFTVLPIRFVWSCLLLVLQILHWKRQRQPRAQFQFHRRHLYQIIQCLIVSLVFRYVLMPISIGKLYHWIRGQSMIKLYVIIAMVELFDRLFSSLGQDCLDSMYWNSITRPGSSRFGVSVLVVLVYAALHALILFVHVATLNVAVNSHDQALLSLLMGGNFAEIKSTVFKKYNKAALFKITASDICERFKLALFLTLVWLLNASQGGMNRSQWLGYLRICGIVWCAEVLADWIKHAFITKFNFLPARVYPEYALLLAGDVTGIGHEGVSLDHSHAVVKRIGFPQIPLLCVMFRLVNEATNKFLRHMQDTHSSGVEETGDGVGSHSSSSSNSSTFVLWLLQSLFAMNGITASLLLWAVLLVLKLGLGLLLQRLSFGKLYAAPEYSQLTPLLMIQQKQAAIHKKTQ